MAIFTNDVAIETLTIPKMDLRDVTLTVRGTSPLIVHAWAEKAKQQMRDVQQKRGKQKKQAKKPEDDYRESLYYVARDDEKQQYTYGFPIVAFKAAASSAWAHTDGFKKGVIRGAFHIVNGIPTLQGDLVELRYSQLRMREDMVRVGMGTSDMRYRGEFSEWVVRLQCRYNARVISAEQLVTLFDVSGFAIGVGEWRPERDGSFGMFRVESVS